jgi:hypothetical protein
MQRDKEMAEKENPYSAPLSLPAISGTGSDNDLSGKFSPLRTIWSAPRNTVRRIVAENPDHHVVLLACLAGIGQALDRASLRNLGDQMPLAVILVVACLFGPLGGLFSLWIGSHLIRLSGKWIGGAGNREHIKTAIAWASVPTVFALLLWIPLILLFGSDMFTAETPHLDAQPMLMIPFFTIAFLEIVLSLWAFVLLCNTIAEVQGFRSAWYGLGNVILAGAIIAVPLLVIALGIVALSQV